MLQTEHDIQMPTKSILTTSRQLVREIVDLSLRQRIVDVLYAPLNFEPALATFDLYMKATLLPR